MQFSPRLRARVKEARRRRIVVASAFPWLCAIGFFARARAKLDDLLLMNDGPDFRRKPLIIEPCRLPRNRARSTRDPTETVVTSFPTANYNLRALHYFPSLVSRAPWMHEYAVAWSVPTVVLYRFFFLFLSWAELNCEVIYSLSVIYSEKLRQCVHGHEPSREGGGLSDAKTIARFPIIARSIRHYHPLLTLPFDI